MTTNESRREFLKKAGFITGSILVSSYVIGKSIFSDPTFVYDPNITSSFTIGDLDESDDLTPEDLSIETSSQKKQFLVSHPVRDGDQSRRVVLITYDDGGNEEQLSTILNAFSEYPNSHATFFFCGTYLKQSARIIECMISEGHTIGCHGWDHVWMDTLTVKEINQSFGKFIQTIRNIIPGYQVEYFRLPYGGCKDPQKYKDILAIAADWGLQHVYWSFYTEGKTPDGRRIIQKNLTKGSIILCHMNYYFDILNTRWMLHYLDYRGYSAETVKTGLSSQNYWTGNL